MNNETNNEQVLNNNEVNATPVATEAPVTPETTQAESTPAPTAAPEVKEENTQQYSTPTINTDNERVIVPEKVVLPDDSKNYNDIEEQVGTSKVENTDNQPQVANITVSEVNNEVAKDNILSSITLEEDDNKQSGDAESVTFDYNALYNTEKKEEVNTTEEDKKEVFSASEIDIQDRFSKARTDLAPEFNKDELLNNGASSDSKAQDNVLSKKQEDRADTRRKITFIGVIVLILIIAVKFIFPLLLK